MKHLGDITKLSGYDVPIVDCVIGGSPCQGLSNAGKRLGLNDERSGLYMERISELDTSCAASHRGRRNGFKAFQTDGRTSAIG